MGNILSKMRFGRIEDGLVRLGLNGQIAVKIGSDYKYYNPKTKRLVNCDDFVFDIGSEFFFVVPTNKVKTGDIILVGNPAKPAYVLAPETDGEIKILSYEDSSIKHILPERHTFLGETYMYSKIVSFLGNKAFDKNAIFKFMMMNSMFGNKSNGGMFGGTNNNGMNPMMLMLMMNGSNPLTSMFDFTDSADGLFDGIFAEDTENDDKPKVIDEKPNEK